MHKKCINLHVQYTTMQLFHNLREKLLIFLQTESERDIQTLSLSLFIHFIQISFDTHVSYIQFKISAEKCLITHFYKKNFLWNLRIC